MDIEAVRAIAKRYRIDCDGLFKNKIIRKIQMHNGQGNCFATNHGDSCRYICCNWREECFAAARIGLAWLAGENEVLWQLIIEESIKLRLNESEIFLGFSHRFFEDAELWRELLIEEKNHVALLKSGARHFLDSGVLLDELVCALLEALVNLNDELKCILRQEKESPMSRQSALSFGIKLKESAGEINFQHAIQESKSSSEAIRLFKNLNEGSQDHAGKIRNYMRQKGIAK